MPWYLTLDSSMVAVGFVLYGYGPVSLVDVSSSAELCLALHYGSCAVPVYCERMCPVYGFLVRERTSLPPN